MRYLTFFLTKNKVNFSNKENCFACGRSNWMSFIHAQYCSFYSCPILFHFLSFNYWIQHYKLFCFKKGSTSRAVFRTFQISKMEQLFKQSAAFRCLTWFWYQRTCFKFAEMTWRLAEHEGRGPGAKAGGCINLIAAVTVTHCNFAFIHSSYSECIHKYSKAKYIVCLIHFYVVTVMYTLMAIQKSRHRHLGINIVIRISISIVIAKKLFLPSEIVLKK